MDWANTTARRDKKHLSFGIWCTDIRGLTVTVGVVCLAGRREWCCKTLRQGHIFNILASGRCGNKCMIFKHISLGNSFGSWYKFQADIQFIHVYFQNYSTFIKYDTISVNIFHRNSTLTPRVETGPSCIHPKWQGWSCNNLMHVQAKDWRHSTWFHKHKIETKYVYSQLVHTYQLNQPKWTFSPAKCSVKYHLCSSLTLRPLKDKVVISNVHFQTHFGN